jgi:hypothetical protein
MKLSTEDRAKLTVDSTGRLNGMSLRRLPGEKGNHLPFEKKVQIGKLLVSGFSACQVAAEVQVSYRTVRRLAKLLNLPMADRRIKHGLCKKGLSRGPYMKHYRKGKEERG